METLSYICKLATITDLKVLAEEFAGDGILINTSNWAWGVTTNIAWGLKIYRAKEKRFSDIWNHIHYKTRLKKTRLWVQI